jgi:hypothetical protein
MGPKLKSTPCVIFNELVKLTAESAHAETLPQPYYFSSKITVEAVL